MRRLSIYFLVGLAVLVVRANWAQAENAQQAQIDAADFDAVDRLRADIVAQRLSPDLTIAEFLQHTGGENDLLDTLRHADQVGGARWLDSQTCQVKLTISADRVRQSLTKIAADNPQTSPLPPEAISAKLKIWDDRTFTATGSSVSPARAILLKPLDPSGPWSAVSDAQRQQAILHARAEAVRHVIDSVKPISISPAGVSPPKTVADLLADQTIAGAFRQWLLDRPVIRMEFNNDLSVQITLAAGPGHAFDSLHDEALAAKSSLLPSDEASLAKIRLAFGDQMASAIGQAAVVAAPATAASAASPPASITIPSQPPQWVMQQLIGQATATYRGSTLKTERNAENAAMDDLRSKIGQLQLDSTTIAGAMKQNKAVCKAIDQAIEQAKPYKIDFLADGRVTVKVSLDAQAVWDALQEMPGQ